MLLLTGISDKIQLVTLAAVTIDVHVSFVDKTGTTVTPGRKNTAVTTATTTDICASPSAGTERNVQTIQIRNKSVSACDIVVQHTDGVTASEMIGVNLSAGWEAEYIDGHGWKVIDATGMVLSGSAVPAGGGIALRGSGTYIQSTGTVQFQNSNGLTFGLVGGAMTASHNGLSTAALSDHSHGVTLNLTNLSGSTGGGSAGISLSFEVSAQSVQPGIQSISGGTTRVTTGEIVFSNSGGIGFGINGQTLTASHNGLTTAAPTNHSHGFSASGGSSAFQTLTFANSNGITFSNSNGSVIASHNALTTARASNDGIGLNTAQTNVTWTVNSSGISFNAGGYAGTGTSATNATITLNTQGLQISVAAPGGGGAALSAGTQSVNTGTVVFSNSNGITFGMSGSSRITASHNGLTTAAISDHTHGNVAFFGTNVSATFDSTSSGMSVSLSVAPPGAGGGFTLQGSGTYTQGTGTISFVNSNGITFGLSTNQMTASHNGLTSQSNQAFSASGGSSAFQTLVFSNSNGITFSNSNGSVIASHNGLTSQSNQAFSASGGSSAFQTLEFQNSNGLTFSNNAGSVRITHGLQYTSNTTDIITGRAGLGTTFAGVNISASMTLNTAGLNLSASVAAPGAGGGIAIADSAATITNQTVVFSDGGNVSFGLAGSTMTASAPAAGGGYTKSIKFMHEDFVGFNTGTVATSEGTAYIWVPLHLDGPLSVSNILLLKSLTWTTGSSSNSSGRQSYSYNLSFYIFRRSDFGANSASLTFYTSASGGFSASRSHTSNQNSISMAWVTNSTGGTSSFSTTGTGSAWQTGLSGPRFFMVPLVTSLSQGEWFVARRHSSTTATVNSNATLVSVNAIGYTMQSGIGMVMKIGSSGSNLSNPFHGIGFGSATAITTNAVMNATVISAGSTALRLPFGVMVNMPWGM